MKDITQRLQQADWETVSETMHSKGFALLPNMLTKEECAQLTASYNTPEFYRKTIVMERYRFGLGEYKYFCYPLPGLIQRIRAAAYEKLSPIANSWMKALNIDRTYPADLETLQAECREKQQVLPTVLILKYGEGGHNTLHQDLYGDIFFPVQLVCFLSEPGQDYTGGEFVLTEQVPRAQSKAIVLQPKQGDILLFTTNFRPVKGSKGYYRVNMKHGVSAVHTGSRYTLGIIFHDALG